jgi:chemotaxis protein methyltransferase CheR
LSAWTASQFARIASIARERWGLNLNERKASLVSNRLARIMRGKPFRDVESFLSYLERQPSHEDVQACFDLLATNVTSFFRERQPFEYLEREFYPTLAQASSVSSNRRLRMWSAACATGPEAYSIVMHALKHVPALAEWDFKVLATDLASAALRTADEAVYPAKLVADLPRDMLHRYFQRGVGAMAGMVRVADHVRQHVTIRQLNLIDHWPMTGPFDVIFCRNVMIYFDRETRERLVNRMYELLRPGGLLAIGSAETLMGLATKFHSVKASVYVK